MIKKIKSYNSKNSFHKKLGDFILLLLAAGQTAIATAPQEALSIKQSYWISLSLTLTCVTINYWCNNKDKKNEI